MMGVDLINVSGFATSFNWPEWRALYRIALKYGWEPAGTVIDDYELKMRGIKDQDGSFGKMIEQWDGSYFCSQLQVVTETDAQNWRKALQKALHDPDYLNSDERLPLGLIREFIDFLSDGPFRIL